ncbi:MAG: hypothetical protein ACOYVD_18480 [Bacillota bacterium]
MNWLNNRQKKKSGFSPLGLLTLGGLLVYALTANGEKRVRKSAVLVTKGILNAANNSNTVFSRIKRNLDRIVQQASPQQNRNVRKRTGNNMRTRRRGIAVGASRETNQKAQE